MATFQYRLKDFGGSAANFFRAECNFLSLRRMASPLPKAQLLLLLILSPRYQLHLVQRLLMHRQRRLQVSLPWQPTRRHFHQQLPKTVVDTTPPCQSWGGCVNASCTNNDGCDDPLVCIYWRCSLVITATIVQCIYDVARLAFSIVLTFHMGRTEQKWVVFSRARWKTRFSLLNTTHPYSKLLICHLQCRY